MEGNSRRPAVGMAELLVGAALADFRKAQRIQDRDDLAGLEYRDPGHLANEDGLRADELGLELGGAIL